MRSSLKNACAQQQFYSGTHTFMLSVKYCLLQPLFGPYPLWLVCWTFFRRRSQHTDQNVKSKLTVLFSTTPNSFRDYNYMVLPQTFTACEYRISTMQSFKYGLSINISDGLLSLIKLLSMVKLQSSIL